MPRPSQAETLFARGLREELEASAQNAPQHAPPDPEPRFLGWSTSDEDEIARRRWRGRAEITGVRVVEPDYPYYGIFRIRSSGDNSYTVEIRHLKEYENSCLCRDFEISGLGTCKHIEGLLHRLRKDGKRAFSTAARAGSSRIEIYVPGRDSHSLQTVFPPRETPDILREEIERLVALLADEPVQSGGSALTELRRLEEENPDWLRVSRLVDRWLAERQRRRRRIENREQFLRDVEAGRKTLEVLRYPLLPHQPAGVLHLAFGERALLADDMGLGKTAQAIAACVLLKELRGIERVLVASPASLKTEWQEQISQATGETVQVVLGSRARRLKQYGAPTFFTLANYEQIVADGNDVTRILRPDIVILDEAQRIKNWRTKTAYAVKQLQSPYAFVLTGTPIENRIDEIYSIVQYLDPNLLGPLFRFNRNYYVLDDRGHPVDYRNLDDLARRLQPVMLRRRKDEVADELPRRSVNNYFLAMTDEQRLRYEDYASRTRHYLQAAKKRPLKKEEFERLQVNLACMRMTCDTPYILDPELRDCPKLEELERVLEELLVGNPDRKIIIFSEWVRMLELICDLADELGLEYALHTGSVPQGRRREEINRFKNDPDCPLFLSSETGGAGLNLQAADTVINMDLPWNPAKLEQRIARAWRKHQTRPVNIVNFITENSIEHRMLFLLEQKQALSDGVIDQRGDLPKLRMPTGRAAFLERLEQVMEPGRPEKGEGAATGRNKPADTAPDPSAVLHECFGGRLVSAEIREIAPDQESLLIVLESENAGDEAKMDGEQKNLAEILGMPVEILDRSAHEALKRLEAAGMVAFSGAPGRSLLGASPPDRSEAESRRLAASALLEQADRQHRLAKLLAGGGFSAEASVQAGEIATLALGALAALTNETGMGTDSNGGGDGGGGDAKEILDRIEECGTLPATLQHKARALLRLGAEGKPEPGSESLHLADAGELVSHVRAAVDDLDGAIPSDKGQKAKKTSAR